MMDRNNGMILVFQPDFVLPVSLDGLIDVRELARLFVYDPQACEEFVRRIIDTVDIDENGKLSFSEFIILMVRNDGMDGVKVTIYSVDSSLCTLYWYKTDVKWQASLRATECSRVSLVGNRLCRIVDNGSIQNQIRHPRDRYRRSCALSMLRFREACHFTFISHQYGIQ